MRGRLLAFNAISSAIDAADRVIATAVAATHAAPIERGDQDQEAAKGKAQPSLGEAMGEGDAGRDRDHTPIASGIPKRQSTCLAPA